MITAETYQDIHQIVGNDQRQQQVDEEQQLHEVLDALYRIDQVIYTVSNTLPAGDEVYRLGRLNIETVARYAQVLQYLHKPLR